MFSKTKFFIFLITFFYINQLFANEFPGFYSENGKKLNFEVNDNKTLINFWASWCTICKSALPSLNELYKKSDNINIYLIAIDENNIQKIKTIHSQLRIEIPISLDDKQKLFSSFNLMAVPSTIILDKNGNLEKTIYGKIDFLNKKFLTNF